MKILISAYSCCPNKGSEPGYGWNWAIEFSKRIDYVYCYTRSIYKKEILEELSNIGITNLEFVFVDPPEIIEKYYYTNKVGLYLHYLSWQWTAYKKASRLKSVHQYENVHHVTMGSLQLGSFMYKLNLPFIFGPVGGGQHAPKNFRCYFGKYWKTEVARKYISSLLLQLNPGTKNSIKHAEVVLVNNLETEAVARKIGAKKVEIFFDTSLPASFYPKTFPTRIYDGHLKILWLGRLLPRKGLLLVLEALALVKDRVNFELLIVGDGEMGVHVNQWIHDLELENHVVWIGQVPFESVKKHYNDANMFILTSLRDSCPLQLLEAMAYGLPIITLDLHGASIAVPNNVGIKIKPTTPEETKNKIANEIVQLSKDHKLLVDYSKNSYEHALTQSWENKVNYLFKKYYNSYENTPNHIA